MRSTGNGTIEFLAVFVVFTTLFLGLFEMTRLYRAKHVLNTATFAAARAGSLHNALIGPMNAELANGMIPLLMSAGTSAENLALARERAIALVHVPGTGVQIVSPIAGTYSLLRKRQWARLGDQKSHSWQEILPNDNLRLRPREQSSIADASGTPEINLQDANLLRIRTVWCHHLVTPLLDRVIFGIATSPIFINDRQKACLLLSSTATANPSSGLYLAISADAIVRMQSAISSGDLPAG